MEPQEHDDEAFALLAFIAIGEQTLAENSQTFEDVEAFLLEI